jgi:hypothetical protein
LSKKVLTTVQNLVTLCSSPDHRLTGDRAD